MPSFVRTAAGSAAFAVAATLATSPAGFGATLRDQQWYLDAIHADAAHRISDGSGVIVAVLDTGVDASHPDLADHVLSGPDLVDGSGSNHDPNGHGTNVAGIIAAQGKGVEGAAPGAKVMSIRILDAQSRGSSDGEAKAIDAAVAGGAQVINLSLAPDPDLIRILGLFDPVVEAVQRAQQSGVVVVAAAGNEALPLCAQPLNMTGILCVAAVQQDLHRSSFSNYGVRVDLVAPGGGDGGGIVSTAPGGGYAAMQGTSQATPQVAATAALLVSLGLRGQQVVDRILATTDDLGPAGVDLDYGHGLLDMQKAVDGLGPVREPVQPPTGSERVGARSAAMTVKAPSKASPTNVAKHGLKVSCTRPTAGTCTVRVLASGNTLIARGEAKLKASTTKKIVAKPTKDGAKRLKKATKLKVTIKATGKGADPATTRLTLRR